MQETYCRRGRARRELRATIEERIGIRPHWDDIERETFQPALRTWRELARRAADDEDLLLDGSADA